MSGSAHPRTSAVRAAIASDREHGAVVPPLHLSATFTFEGLGRPRTYDYTRSGNPTRDHLGNAVAELEGGIGGVVTASGMSAVLAVLHLLERDELLLAPHDCYGGTHRLIRALAAKEAFRVQFVDFTDEWALETAVANGSPRMLWVETPSNPLLRITDVRRVVELAGLHDALVVTDNTFLSPALQRPLDLGSDLVVHSTTKYLNGHSDVVGGAVVSARQDLVDEVGWWANCLGVTGSPFDSYLTLRGIRTLHARMALHDENARAVVELLVDHPAVERVHHPSLPDHPGHTIAAAQQSGWGSMVSFELAGGVQAVELFLDGLACFSLAESLGGVESLVAHPSTMTHAAMDPAARARAGIRDSLLRLSVGIEHSDDLVRDLSQALRRAEEAACVVV